MATKQSTADYILDQVTGAGKVRIRKMFGEYALYCDEKVVALICDDRLFVKPTAAGKKFIGKVVEAPPYPSAKPFYVIDEEKWDDRDWLSVLIRKTADEVPVPKKKK
jgi:TfoX/Sxy family transcriptional regulator of competence genes